MKQTEFKNETEMIQKINRKDLERKHKEFRKETERIKKEN